MLTNRGRNREPPPDPEEILTGKCDTCGHVVRCKRGAARLPDRTLRFNHQGGMWDDLPCVGCPNCRTMSIDGRVVGEARVYLVPARV